MKPQLIRFACNSCGARLAVPASMAGRSDHCPKCHEVITAPQESTLAPKPRAEKSPAPEKKVVHEYARAAALPPEPDLFQGLSPSLLDNFLSAPVKTGPTEEPPPAPAPAPPLPEITPAPQDTQVAVAPPPPPPLPPVEAEDLEPAPHESATAESPPEPSPEPQGEEEEETPVEQLEVPTWTPPALDEETEDHVLHQVGMGHVLEDHSTSSTLHTTRHVVPSLGVGLIHLEDLPGRHRRRRLRWFFGIGIVLIFVVDALFWFRKDIGAWWEMATRPKGKAEVMAPAQGAAPSAVVHSQDIKAAPRSTPPATPVPDKKKPLPEAKEVAAPALPPAPRKEDEPKVAKESPATGPTAVKPEEKAAPPPPTLAEMPTEKPAGKSDSLSIPATPPPPSLADTQSPLPAPKAPMPAPVETAVPATTPLIPPPPPLPGMNHPLASTSSFQLPETKPEPEDPPPPAVEAAPSTVAKLEVPSPPPIPPLPSSEAGIPSPTPPAVEKVPEAPIPLPVPETKPPTVDSSQVTEIGITSAAQPALDSLKKFLFASNLQERIKYCQKGDSLRKEMEKHYKTHPDGPVPVRQIELIERYTNSNGGVPYCTFWVRGGEPSQSVMTLVEEPVKGPPRVDWEAFVEFKDRLLWEFLEKPGAASRKFRVMIRRKHYFDKDVPDVDDKESFLLLQPGSDGEGHVFAAHDSGPARQLAQTLGWGTTISAIIELTWRRQDSHRWVEISAVNTYGWRN